MYQLFVNEILVRDAPYGWSQLNDVFWIVMRQPLLPLIDLLLRECHIYLRAILVILILKYLLVIVYVFKVLLTLFVG